MPVELSPPRSLRHQPLAPAKLLPVSVGLPLLDIWTFPTNGLTHYVASRDWLPPLA